MTPLSSTNYLDLVLGVTSSGNNLHLHHCDSISCIRPRNTRTQPDNRVRAKSLCETFNL